MEMKTILLQLVIYQAFSEYLLWARPWAARYCDVGGGKLADRPLVQTSPPVSWEPHASPSSNSPG